MPAPRSSLPIPAPASVLATGAYLKNRACLVHDKQAQWSCLHGNLDDPVACVALDHSVDMLCNSAGVAPVALGHDMHPDFYSSRLAVTVATRLGVPAIPVQHHHAHIASTIAEQGIKDPVIGIALDGVGYGTDGKAWGGEVLWLDGGYSAHRWRRLAHLYPVYLPGGDRAVQEPWRLAAAVLHDSGRSHDIEMHFMPRVGRQATDIVRTMLDRGLNCPASTSAGRWFDAAAAALGLSTRQSREGEAAALLEDRAQQFLQHEPDFNVTWQSLDLRPVIASLIDIDTENSADVGRGAATFHLALVSALAHATISAAQVQSVHDVVFGGGCFVNKLLRDRLTGALRQAGLRVHVPDACLCGDTGLAIGQAWVAACTLHETAGKMHQTPGSLHTTQDSALNMNTDKTYTQEVY